MPAVIAPDAPSSKPQRIFDDVPWVGDFGTLLAYLYLLRVPLITCTLLAALPVLAVPRNAPAGSLLRGLFDIVEPETGFWVTTLTFGLLTLAALFVAITVAISARLILLDGHRRFEVRELPPSDGVQVLVRLVPLVAAAICTAGAWVQTWPSLKPTPTHSDGRLAAFTGTVVAVAFCFLLMTVVHDRLWDAVFPDRPSRLTSNRILKAVVSFFVSPFEWAISKSPKGYIGNNGKIRKRHLFALLQFFVSIAFYIALFALKYPLAWKPGYAPRIPTLCLIFVLAMLLTWGLTGITFFFDRFRVPLLSVLFALGTVLSIFPWNDHFFKTIAVVPQPDNGVPASAVLQKHEYEPAIVVAAAGGGIQAAAWTASVLSRIEQDSLNCHTDFGDALMAISGVSGGSVGAMYFLDAYDTNGQLNHDAVVHAETAAGLSSLDEVAWGLTYPDLFWGLFPFARGFHQPFLVRDRGSALEDSWKRTDSLNKATLNGWRNDLSAWHRPAALFNATVAETGERMIFGTTTFDRANEGGRHEFSRDFADLDVPIATAVRMSATFPYVSPPARVSRNAGFDEQFHYVDGGYYDNYGTATMIDWLEGGLHEGYDHSPSMILMLEIRSFPDDDTAKPAASRGWFADLVQPLRTLYGVRGAGQAAHSELSGHLMEDDWHFTRRTITFPAHLQEDVAPPLSWHLTPADRAAIRQARDSEGLKDSRRFVQMFLGVGEDDANRCVN